MTAVRPENWVLATANAGKLAEFRALLAPGSFEIRPLSDFGLSQTVEPGLTFVENALIKARHAARATGLPAIADDSGLAVDALNGAPGVHSARFAGPEATDAENLELLLARLADVAGDARRARFHCVIVALPSAEDPAPVVAQATWHGRIATARRGNRGFGYDPVFVPTESGKTAAELPAEAKNRLSHRGQALRSLKRKLGIAES